MEAMALREVRLREKELKSRRSVSMQVIVRQSLSEVFHSISLNTAYRRELRRKLGKGSHHHTEEVIHRSPECKGLLKYE
jgi:hypothetical protein